MHLEDFVCHTLLMGIAPILKMTDMLVALFTALLMGLLFTWWGGAVALLVGLVLVLRRKRKGSTPSHKEGAKDGRESGEWLEEWHGDMRRWQIGPYEWRD